MSQDKSRLKAKLWAEANLKKKRKPLFQSPAISRRNAQAWADKTLKQNTEIGRNGNSLKVKHDDRNTQSTRSEKSNEELVQPPSKIQRTNDERFGRGSDFQLSSPPQTEAFNKEPARKRSLTSQKAFPLQSFTDEPLEQEKKLSASQPYAEKKEEENRLRKEAHKAVSGTILSAEKKKCTKAADQGPSHWGLSPPGTLSSRFPSDKKTGGSFFSPLARQQGALPETSVNSTGAGATSMAPSMRFQSLLTGGTKPSTFQGGGPVLSGFAQNTDSTFKTNLTISTEKAPTALHFGNNGNSTQNAEQIPTSLYSTNNTNSRQDSGSTKVPSLLNVGTKPSTIQGGSPAFSGFGQKTASKFNTNLTISTERAPTALHFGNNGNLTQNAEQIPSSSYSTNNTRQDSGSTKVPSLLTAGTKPFTIQGGSPAFSGFDQKTDSKFKPNLTISMERVPTASHFGNTANSTQNGERIPSTSHTNYTNSRQDSGSTKVELLAEKKSPGLIGSNSVEYAFGQRADLKPNLQISTTPDVGTLSGYKQVQSPACFLPASVMSRLPSPGLGTGKKDSPECFPLNESLSPSSSKVPPPAQKPSSPKPNPFKQGKSLQKKSGWKAGTLFSVLFVLTSLSAIIMFLLSSYCSNLIARTKQYFGKCYLSSDDIPTLHPSDSCRKPLLCPLNGKCRSGKLIDCISPFTLTEERCVLPKEQALAYKRMALDLRIDTINHICQNIWSINKPPAPSIKYDAAADLCPAYRTHEETEQCITNVFIEEMYERNQDLISLRTSYARSLPKAFSCSSQLFLRENTQVISVFVLLLGALMSLHLRFQKQHAAEEMKKDLIEKICNYLHSKNDEVPFSRLQNDILQGFPENRSKKLAECVWKEVYAEMRQNAMKYQLRVKSKKYAGQVQDHWKSTKFQESNTSEDDHPQVHGMHQILATAK